MQQQQKFSPFVFKNFSFFFFKWERSFSSFLNFWASSRRRRKNVGD
jgi:hypothetical protein